MYIATTLVILYFMTIVIGPKIHKIETIINTINMYNSYELPIIIIPSHEMGRIRNHKCAIK